MQDEKKRMSKKIRRTNQQKAIRERERNKDGIIKIKKNNTCWSLSFD